jgi:hypothetical protein
VPGGGCVLRRLSPGEVSVGRFFPLAVRFLLVSDFLSGRRARGVFFYTAFALSFPSSSLKLPPSQAFIGSPTHPHLKDHLRCLAADAGRTGAQLLGELREVCQLLAGPERKQTNVSRAGTRPVVMFSFSSARATAVLFVWFTVAWFICMVEYMAFLWSAHRYWAIDHRNSGRKLNCHTKHHNSDNKKA